MPQPVHRREFTLKNAHLTLDFWGSHSSTDPSRLYLVVHHPEIGLAFALHCFEVGPFDQGYGEKRGDGGVVFRYTARLDGDELACTTTFEPRPGGRISMDVEVDGPLERLKGIRFIDGCMQHWNSPAFGRRGALSEFVERCFVYTMRGPTGLLETARGKHKTPLDSQWNNPGCTQWYPNLDVMHPGDIWAFGTCGDRPVHNLIGATSRDGRWLTAMGGRYNLNIGQGWHDCLHTVAHTRWYVDEDIGKIQQKGMLYAMPNDKEKLLTAFLEDFPVDTGPARSIPADQEGLRAPRQGVRTGAYLEVDIRGRTLWIGPAQTGAPMLECSFEAAGSGTKTETVEWERMYWGTHVRRGEGWRMWAHPRGNALDICVSLAEAQWKELAHTTVSIQGKDWSRVQTPGSVPATVLCSRDGRWTAAFFWERPEKGDASRGVPRISEPGGKSLCVRGRLILYEGSPEELAEQWRWASADWAHATPYRMPATDEPVVRPGQMVSFAPGRQNGEQLTYGLTIEPPWRDAGTLHVNFPEHLEYDDEDPEGEYVGYSILRHYDAIAYPWKIPADARSAWYNVESPHLPGVEIEARFTANGPVAVWWMKITNGSSKALPRVKPLLCFQYAGLTRFPQHQDNFQHTYVLMNGEVICLADVETAEPAPRAMVAYAEGNSQHDCDRFARSRGGLVEHPIDSAVAAVTSLDGRRKIVIASDPPKSVLSNTAIPCLHADPFFGTLRPGASREVSGALLFTEEDIDAAMSTMVQREWVRGAGR